MVVGSTTVEPGMTGTIKVSVIMHQGMDGPHLFHIFVRSSDPEKRVSLLKVKADIVPLESWRRSHPGAFYLPRRVDGFQLRQEIEGNGAVLMAGRVFRQGMPVKNAYLGRYSKDKKRMRLLVSEYQNDQEGKRVFSGMIDGIRKRSNGSKRLKKIMIGETAGYSLKNRAHTMYYFRFGPRLVLILPDGSISSESLEEVVSHFRNVGA